MSYADLNYYVSLGLEIEDEAALEARLKQASDDVDALCYGRIRKAGLSFLLSFSLFTLRYSLFSKKAVVSEKN